MKAVMDWDETARVAALRALGILDTPQEGGLDELVASTARICRTPVAALSFLDSDREWFKSGVEWSQAEIPRAGSVCADVILQPDVFVVCDLAADERFRESFPARSH